MTTARLHLGDIQIRDPFLVTDHENATYYLFGSTDADVWGTAATGFDCYRSADLHEWEGPIPAFRPSEGFWADRQFWAPEVHEFNGRWYMLATFKSETARRGTQILVADQPAGPFVPWSNGPVTPREWECLDGTLFIDESGSPWIVYCHEWVQIMDGEIVAQRLTADLRATQGEPVVLLSASQAPWARRLRHPQLPEHVSAYVTDGPSLYRLESGTLLMLWSSMGDDGYALGISRSESGTILGPWTHDEVPLWPKDGGHGMVATTLTGELKLVLHAPNETPRERAVLTPLAVTDQELRLA